MLRFLLLIVSLVSVSVAGVKDLELSCDVETGYVPQWSSMVYQTPEEYSYHCYKQTFLVSLKPCLEYKFFSVKYNYIFFISPNKNSYTAMPFRGTWDLETGIRIRFVSLKYAHNCGHTIVTASKPLRVNPVLTDVAYDKFSIVIHISNNR